MIVYKQKTYLYSVTRDIMTLRIKLGLLGRVLLTFEKCNFRHPASPISIVSLGCIFDFAKLHLLIQLQVEGN